MKLYIKNGVVRAKAKISVICNGTRIFNPKEKQLFEDGWSTYTPTVQESIEIPIEEQYKQRVIELIRERYSVDDELAILRQRDSKVEEFNEYNAFVESVKVIAHNEIYGEGEI